MTFKSSKDLKMILHPYAFILKGGEKFDKNLLDYQLMIVQMSSPETIKSPPHSRQVKLNTGKTFSLAKKAPPEKKKPKMLDQLFV